MSEFRLRPLSRGDLAAMRKFVAALPDHDLLFVARDLRHPKVIEAWLRSIDEDSVTSLIAEGEEGIVGTSAIIRDPLGWSPHVGEIRLLVAVDHRGKAVGRELLQATLRAAIDMDLRKLTAHMTVDQTAAIALFESLGFRGEAMLRNHVRDRNGAYHDLAVLSSDLPRLIAQMKAFGLDRV